MHRCTTRGKFTSAETSYDCEMPKDDALGLAFVAQWPRKWLFLHCFYYSTVHFQLSGCVHFSCFLSIYIHQIVIASYFLRCILIAAHMEVYIMLKTSPRRVKTLNFPSKRMRYTCVSKNIPNEQNNHLKKIIF